jgi:hypothetical protein
VKLIWSIIKFIYKTLKNLFVGNSGIFVEYFKASKGDYCPGIDWEE